MRANRTGVVSLLALALGASSISAGSGGDVAERLSAALGFGATASSDVRAQASSEVFTSVSVVNSAGIEIAAMEPDSVGEGVVAVGDRLGRPKAGMLVHADGAGLVSVFNSAGTPTFSLHGNMGLISSAADLAEVFPAQGEIEPGSVLVIDTARKGGMAVARQPYDRRVAGVASGARDFRPGITLGMSDGIRGVTMTLSGTVYCLVTNANGPIRSGDLLTTSGLAGHAMRVTDHPAAQGAILGKALEDFDGRSGLALILASLN